MSTVEILLYIITFIFFFNFGNLINRNNFFYRECNEPVCFVPNCETPNVLPLYNFPFADKRLLYIWLKRTGLSTLYDMDLYLYLAICKNHFHENCFLEKSMQLKPYAIPSINLIGKHLIFYSLAYII